MSTNSEAFQHQFRDFVTPLRSFEGDFNLNFTLFMANGYYFGKTRDRGVDSGLREPYLNHVIRVTNMLIDSGIRDKSLLEASLLHDVVEDTDVSYKTIEKIFSREVCDIVWHLTQQDSKPINVYAEQFRINEDDYLYTKQIKSKALLIKMADRIDNLRLPKKGKEQAKIDETKEHFIGVFEQPIGEYFDEGSNYEEIRTELLKEVKNLCKIN